MLGATRSYARLRCALRGNVPVRRAQQRVAGLKKWRATVLFALVMYTLLILCGLPFTVKKQSQEQRVRIAGDSRHVAETLAAGEHTGRLSTEPKEGATCEPLKVARLLA